MKIIFLHEKHSTYNKFTQSHIQLRQKDTGQQKNE